MLVSLAFASNALFNFLVGVLVARFLGPAEYGLFAIAWASAVVINTAGYDWIRLSATRFYSQRSRLSEPQVRATLDACFAGVTSVIAGVTSVIALAVLVGAFMPLELTLSPTLLALAALTGAAGGLFDYATALARGRFLDRIYLRVVFTKNALGLLLSAGGAYAFSSAKIALAGICLSVGGALATSWRAMRDPGAGPRAAKADLARRYFAYGAPFIAASVLLQLMPLGNRLWISWHFGLEEAGQFSLANDLGIRIFAAVASAMDVFLFQLAVRADAVGGADAARGRLAENLTLMLAVLAPMGVGFCLCLPSLEAVLAPPAYRGPFQAYLLALAPGLIAFVALMYGVAPVFQIAKRTRPMIAAALAGCAIDALLLFALQGAGNGLALAGAQSAGLTASLLVAIGFAAAAGTQWPSLRDLLAIAVSTLAMALGVWSLRALPPGLPALIIQSAVGAGIYGGLAFALDAANLRRRAASLGFSNH